MAEDVRRFNARKIASAKTTAKTYADSVSSAQLHIYKLHWLHTF